LNFTIEAIGPNPLVINSSNELIELIIPNAIRNSIEASREGTNNRIAINWGDTDKGYWISILDEGIGLPVGMQNVFELGLLC
jgi:signal transduction histidine kinase